MLSETRPTKVGKWTEPALRILRERYLMRQAGEVVETPEEMCWRVALTIATGEARYGRSDAAVREVAAAFYDIMIEGEFLPNSPTLMNAGKGNGLQYSACYVLPVGDSMEEIFDSVKAAAIIHKSGGGTGFAFSRLRPKDDIVASTGDKSDPIAALPNVLRSPAGEHVHRGRLLGHQRGLALRQDDDAGDELEPLRAGTEVAEQHEHLVEGTLIRVRRPAAQLVEALELGAEHVVEQPADQLQCDVLERQRRPVEQLEQVHPLAQRHERRDRRLRASLCRTSDSRGCASLRDRARPLPRRTLVAPD